MKTKHKWSEEALAYNAKAKAIMQAHRADRKLRQKGIDSYV